MTTALALRAPALLADPEELFPRADAGPLAELLSEHAADRDRIERLAAVVAGDGYEGVIQHFIAGNVTEGRGTASAFADRLFRPEGAIKALTALSWQRALALTDVYQVMPQKRRDEWNAAIAKHEVPEFDVATVTATIGDLLAQRAQFFAEKVDGVFRVLSGEHVTNRPQGFSKRMIISYIHNGWGPDQGRTGYISDLRAAVAKFLRVEEPAWGSSRRAVEIGMRNSGEWMDIDGGAIRLRVYKKGTAHLEIHPDMAWRLNAVLHELYPRAIAAEHRQRESKPRAEVRPIQRPLPGVVLDVIADMRRVNGSNRWELSWYRHEEAGKAVRAEVVRVLESLGGVVSGDRLGEVEFDYDAGPVLDELLTSGCIPDRVSFQYYPTPEVIARLAVELADIGPEHRVLEPSAGTGSIASLLPPERTTCVELSRLHATVLRQRGLEVVEGDFLEWMPESLFDRIVANPPYSEGRHQAHLQRAAEMLAPGGRLVAILPASQRGKDVLPGFRQEWSDVFENEFAGTSAAVVILKAERNEGAAC